MLASRNVVVSIRRNYIYEDAFDKLSQENGICLLYNLKSLM